MSTGCGETSRNAADRLTTHRKVASNPEPSRNEFRESAATPALPWDEASAEGRHSQNQKPAGDVATSVELALPLAPALPAVSAQPSHLGIGPGEGGDKYAHVAESSFASVRDEPRSTFSIDVDTAAYSKTRMHLLQPRFKSSSIPRTSPRIG